MEGTKFSFEYLLSGKFKELKYVFKSVFYGFSDSFVKQLGKFWDHYFHGMHDIFLSKCLILKLSEGKVQLFSPKCF